MPAERWGLQSSGASVAPSSAAAVVAAVPGGSCDMYPSRKTTTSNRAPGRRNVFE
jgi:hypothetical protein